MLRICLIYTETIHFLIIEELFETFTKENGPRLLNLKIKNSYDQCRDKSLTFMYNATTLINSE